MAVSLSESPTAELVSAVGQLLARWYLATGLNADGGR